MCSDTSVTDYNTTLHDIREQRISPASSFSASLEILCMLDCGPGSSVGIAADYGLDGPGSNPGGDEIFRPSRPALGSTQLPVKWVPGLSRG